MELPGTMHLKQRRRAFFDRDLEQNKRNVIKERGTRIDRTIKADPLSLNNLKTYAPVAAFHAFLNQHGTSDENLFTNQYLHLPSVIISSVLMTLIIN